MNWCRAWRSTSALPPVVGKLRVTDNLPVNPADFTLFTMTTFTMTTPVNPLLEDNSGVTVNGPVDVVSVKFGQVQNYNTLSRSATSLERLDFAVNARMQNGITVMR
jgi:hypothetical protein